MRITVTTSGHPQRRSPRRSKAIRSSAPFTRSTGAGRPAEIKQNDRFVVALKVTETEAAYARLILVDRLPAGLEIDNPDLFDGGSTEALAWVKATVAPTHTEYRDDRFVAAFERDGTDKATFAVAYVVRAVTPGPLYPAAGDDRGHVPPRTVRTHRLRHGRYFGERKQVRPE